MFGNKRKLSDEQCIEIRKLYYYEYKSFTKLGKQYNVSASLIQKIIEGRNSYQHIKDSIPEEVKQKRKPARIKYALHVRSK